MSLWHLRLNEWLHILAYSALGCLGMAIQDTVGVTLVKAIGAGRAVLAGLCDVAADVAKIVILSVSGVELTHAFGWKGYVGVVPILVTGFVVTFHATRLSARIVDEDEVKADRMQDDRIATLEARVEALHRSQGKS